MFYSAFVDFVKRSPGKEQTATGKLKDYWFHLLILKLIKRKENISML